MSFAYEKTGETVTGNMRVTMGTFSGASPTTEALVTGLSNIQFFDMTDLTAVTTSGGTATVSTGTAAAGFWWAMGW